MERLDVDAMANSGAGMMDANNKWLLNIRYSTLLINFCCLFFATGDRATAQIIEDYRTCLLSAIKSGKVTSAENTAAVKELCADLYERDITNNWSAPIG